MGMELWQFAVMVVVGAGVIALWITFVYLPRRTGEEEPQNIPEEPRSPGDPSSK